MDRGYTNFPTHLHVGTSTLSLPTIQATLSHYLAHASPLPTPLAGTVVSSPLFLALTYPKLQTLLAAFRYAFHVKYQLLEKELNERRSQSLGLGLLSNVLSRSTGTRLKQWAGAILKGLQGGHPILRLACCSGLLLGMEDLRVASMSEGGKESHTPITFEGSWVKGNIEDEVMVSMAESIDRYSFLEGDAGWEREFRKMVDTVEVDAISLSLILTAQCAPLIPSDKFRAMPLQTLARLLSSAVEASFLSGSFLSTLSASCTVSHDGTLIVLSEFGDRILGLSSSPLFINMGPLSRLAARTISSLVTIQPKEGLLAANAILGMLTEITVKVEMGWKDSPLADLSSNEMTMEVQALAKTIWSILKTLLFAVIMIAKESLRESIYVPPPLLQDTYGNSTSLRPPVLALRTLRILCNLSYAVFEFGGIASLTTSDQGGGFRELKETFYLALDILTGHYPSPNDQHEDGFSQTEAWAHEICDQVRVETSFDSSDMIAPIQKYRNKAHAAWLRSKTAFIMATLEQLIPSLGEDALQDWVLPLCLPILENDEHREIYESAHSVVLAIFSSRSQSSPTQPYTARSSNSPRLNVIRMKEHTQQSASTISADIGVRLAPFYVNCLIESSREGKLNTTQLRLAYSAVVRCASVSARTISPEEPTSAGESQQALTWYCIETLLNAIREQSDERAGSRATGVDEERLHRLHLMLISSIPSLPMVLLPRVLDEIRFIIMRNSEPHREVGSTPIDTPERVKRRTELIKALLAEILEGVGDQEKDFVMRWWHDNRHGFQGDFETSTHAVHRNLGNEDAGKEAKNPDVSSLTIKRIPES